MCPGFAVVFHCCFLDFRNKNEKIKALVKLYVFLPTVQGTQGMQLLQSNVPGGEGVGQGKLTLGEMGLSQARYTNSKARSGPLPGWKTAATARLQNKL